MTVAEAIEVLKKMPQDAYLCTRPDSEDSSDAVGYRVRALTLGAGYLDYQRDGGVLPEPPEEPVEFYPDGDENYRYKDEIRWYNDTPKDPVFVIYVR